MLVDWFDSWRDLGCLPFDGSFADQPIYVIEALTECQRLTAALRPADGS